MGSPAFRPSSGSTPITASMLYDLVNCPHRVSMDLFADPAERDGVSPFVQLLWDRGSAHEKDVMTGLRQPFLDLSMYAGDEKERRTLDAMNRGEPLIYGGRISAGDLLGEPDLAAPFRVKEAKTRTVAVVPGGGAFRAGPHVLAQGEQPLARPWRRRGEAPAAI